MKSAPKKVTTWKKQTMASIQARCSEMGWQNWRKKYMLERFDKDSMTLLTETKL